jgi:hypothetical protein
VKRYPEGARIALEPTGIDVDVEPARLVARSSLEPHRPLARLFL